jgi:3-hydroxyisobutyrate dehydrogenase-like beta-hydroxyacid dehydrogenase
MQSSIAFLGLGAMGYHMAENLVKSERYRVHLWNRTLSKAESLASQYNSQYVTVAKTAKEAIESSSKYIIIMMFDYKSIVDTLFSEQHEKIDLNNKVVIQMCTVSVEESKDLDRRVTEAGGKFIESPVLGTNIVAQSGQLKIFIGATKDQFEEIQNDNVLQPLGKLFYIGEKPKAIKMKLSMNYMVFSMTAVTANALALVERSDLDTNLFTELIHDSPFHFKYFDFKGKRMLQRDYEDPNFSVGGALKDMKCINEFANSIGVYDGVIQGCVDLLDETTKTIDESKDFAAIYEVMNPPK